MPSYQTYTLQQAVTDLAQQLYDSDMQFWREDTGELQRYLIESLRTWNSLTSYWRSEFAFTLSSNWWYDLTTQTGTLRPYTVTDQDLLSMIELHLLEPITSTYPLVWTGTKQFNLDNIFKSLQVKLDETLSATGCTVTRGLVNAGPVVRTFIGENAIDIRRCAWIPDDATFANIPLYSDDDWGKEAFNPGYTVAPQQPPSTYRQTTQPQLAFDVDYIPPVAGQYEVLTVNAGPTLNITAPTILPVPSDWSWVIKWGAMEDLLSLESQAKDGLRAAYADKRYTDGIKMMMSTPALLAARVNNIPVGVDAVRNADNFRPLWQNETPGVPESVYVAGLNLVAVVPQPDAGPYSLTASVVQNAPIPTGPGDFMQIGRDDYDVILDYAQHLAAYKMGGQEFLATLPLLEGFFRRATLYNSKLSALGMFQPTQYEVSQLQTERQPVYGKEVPV